MPKSRVNSPIWALVAIVALFVLSLCLFLWHAKNVKPRANERLFQAFYPLTQANKAYCPSEDEAREWIRFISEGIRDRELWEWALRPLAAELGYGEITPEEYCVALLLAESDGNATTKTDSGMTRGVMCVQVDAARDVCRRRGLKVDNVAIALYNPRFNIACGTDHLGWLLLKYRSLKWATTYYNCGEKRVAQWMARGVGIKHSHYKRTVEKLKLLKGGDSE